MRLYPAKASGERFGITERKGHEELNDGKGKTLPVVVNSPMMLLNSDSCGAVCAVMGKRDKGLDGGVRAGNAAGMKSINRASRARIAKMVQEGVRLPKRRWQGCC